MCVYNIYTICMYLSLSIYIYICICVHVNTYMYVCIYVCVYVCVYIYIYTYIYIHVYVYPGARSRAHRPLEVPDSGLQAPVFSQQSMTNGNSNSNNTYTCVVVIGCFVMSLADLCLLCCFVVSSQAPNVPLPKTCHFRKLLGSRTFWAA